MVTVDDGAVLRAFSTGRCSHLPPMVLLHGGPGLWDYLAPLAAVIGERTVVHRYDQRGGGGSDDLGPFTTERWLADLDGLRRHWGHPRWVVVGHSFGATVALQYVATRPQDAAGLGYVSGVGIGDWRARFHDNVARRLTISQVRRLAELSDILDRDVAQERELRTLSWFTDYPDPAVGLRHAAEMASSPHAIRWDINATLNAGDDELTDPEALRLARSVLCPSAFVHGRDDPRPWESVADLADTSGVGPITVLDGAGHLPWVERPEAVAGLLLDLLDRVRSARSSGQ